jgi:ABC-2 type transport system ATP-binding protein
MTAYFHKDSSVWPSACQRGIHEGIPRSAQMLREFSYRFSCNVGEKAGQGCWMTTAFVLEDVIYRFGPIRALDGLSLAVRQGEVYGFLGRNGAGKTTTLRLLMGILRPHGGTIELLGSRVDRVPVSLKRRIGYVSQEPTFYPWMNAQQLGAFVGSFYPAWEDAEFRRLLAMLDVPMDRRAADLSGGTRSKLGLALALAPRPDLLLLDEPTAGLDPVARAEFNDQLMALQRERGTTVFFSSHLVGEVEKLADRVGIVQAGRTCFEGRVVDLRDSVRRLALTDDAVPEGFERLRGDIFRADPARWEEAASSGISAAKLSLEDIFLAFARTDRLQA